MEFVIKNLMETIVESKLNELIKGVDCCKCDKCRMDITAYVLNRLPAKYVSTEKGALFAGLDLLNDQHDADVMSNILKAIDLIAKNPHHWTPEEAMENGIKKKEDVAKVTIHDQPQQRPIQPQIPVQQRPPVKTPMTAQQQRPIQSQIPVQQRSSVKTPMTAQQQRPVQSQIPVQQRPVQTTPISAQQQNQKPIQSQIPVQQRSVSDMDKGQTEKLAEQVLNERISNIKAENRQKTVEIEKNSTKNYKSATNVLEHISTKKANQKEGTNADTKQSPAEDDETYSSSDLDLPRVQK